MNNSAEHCVGIIVSIGTGKHLQGRFQGTGLKRYIGFVNFATKWASESEVTHTFMERLDLPCYARFNVDIALGSIRLDEWRYRGSLRLKTGKAIGKLRSRREGGHDGHDGQTTKKKKPLDGPAYSTPITLSSASSTSSTSTPSFSLSETKIPKFFRPKNKTLEKMKKHTDEYLSCLDTKALIHEYAQHLVEMRRARADQDEERWGKNCYRIWYHCKIPQCPRGEPKYTSRDALRKHIRNKHSDHAHSAEEIERTLDRCKFLIP